MANNNATNDGTRTAHGLYVAQGGATTPNYLVLSAGQVPIGTTSGDPSGATLTQGTGITITSATGSITIAATASSPALVWIASVTASTSASVIFSKLLSSTYDNYLVTFEAVTPDTATVYMQVQYGYGATPTYDTNANNYTNIMIGTSTTSGTYSYKMVQTAGSIPDMIITPTNSGSLMDKFIPMGGMFWLIGANNGTSSVTFNSIASASYLAVDSVSGNYGALANCSAVAGDSSHAVNTLKFTMSSGNILTGTYKLYGIQN